MLELSYWKALVSNALREFQQNHNIEAAKIIKISNLRIDQNNYDNWNGGTYYWDLIFELKFNDYRKFESRKNDLETVLLETLEKYHKDNYNPIANVLIQVEIKHYIDWQTVLPNTKTSTLELIEEERKLLEAIATGTSYKNDGIEDKFKSLHNKLILFAEGAGFDYPITCNSLAEWWIQVRDVGGYTDRRAFISQIYAPIIKLINESEEVPAVDFSRIATKSEAVRKAVEDAEVFLRGGSYDSAVDRVHTAFHGYLKQVLIEHDTVLCENESLTALFNKLHSVYAENIQPVEVGDRIRMILRSAGGMVNAINELRNNNTIAHPNGQLIQKREAYLVIRLINVIVDYIEEIEQMQDNM